MMATLMTERPSPVELEEEDVAVPDGRPEYKARYERARKRVQAVRGFYIHLAIYLVVNLFLFAINMLSNSESIWFYWPLLGWGIAVVINGLLVFGPLAEGGTKWEERKIQEYMEKDR
jgi:2TM domain-containing protein